MAKSKTVMFSKRSATCHHSGKMINIFKEWNLFSSIATKNEQLRAVHIMLQLLEGLGHIMLQILFCVMQIIMVIIISPAAIKMYRAKATSLLAYGTQIYNYHNLAVL